MSENNGHDRDERGRFRKGHAKPGPGRPARETETEYLATLAETCSPERWRAICQRAIADAESGDCKARSWLTRLLIGDSPKVAVELFNMTSDSVRILEHDDWYENQDRLRESE